MRRVTEPLLRLADDPEVAVRHAHPAALAVVGGRLLRREEREADLAARPRARATRPAGAGTRARAEEPDPFRLCFERDLDRIKHSRPWRRLAGKCQVFVAPEDDHLRTRLTHAVEVAQVATGIARAANLCLPLVEAIALAHDCGHGPAGPRLRGRVRALPPRRLRPRRLRRRRHARAAQPLRADARRCPQPLVAPPAPATAEGEVVAWADRIAYVCHDFEDACRAGHPHARRSPGRGRRRRRHAALGADRGIRPRGARRHRAHRPGRR